MHERKRLTLCRDSDAAMAHSPSAGASACSGSPCSPGSYGNPGEGAKRALPSDRTRNMYYSAQNLAGVG